MLSSIFLSRIRGGVSEKTQKGKTASSNNSIIYKLSCVRWNPPSEYPGNLRTSLICKSGMEKLEVLVG